jgi:hypothetical protein
MQHATLPDRDTTRGTRDRDELFGREFFLFHSGTLLQGVWQKLSNMGHCIQETTKHKCILTALAVRLLPQSNRSVLHDRTRSQHGNGSGPCNE